MSDEQQRFAIQLRASALARRLNTDVQPYYIDGIKMSSTEALVPYAWLERLAKTIEGEFS